MYKSELRGVFFRQPEEREYASALSIGSRLSLIREPENEYDSYAIKVVARLNAAPGNDFYEYHIGYVAREIAMWVAPEMDQTEDEIYFATVIGFETKKNTTYPILAIGTESNLKNLESLMSRDDVAEEEFASLFT